MGDTFTMIMTFISGFEWAWNNEIGNIMVFLGRWEERGAKGT